MCLHHIHIIGNECALQDNLSITTIYCGMVSATHDKKLALIFGRQVEVLGYGFGLPFLGMFYGQWKPNPSYTQPKS